MISPDHLRRIAFWSRDPNEAEFERSRGGIVGKTFARGVYICHRGDRLDYWTGVESGLVKLGTVSRNGKAVTMAGLRAGARFGEGTVLKNEPRRYDLVALRDTQLALMNRSTFFWLFENSVAFNRFLVRQFNERSGCWMGQAVWRATSGGCSIRCFIPTRKCTSRSLRRRWVCCRAYRARPSTDT